MRTDAAQSRRPGFLTSLLGTSMLLVAVVGGCSKQTSDRDLVFVDVPQAQSIAANEKGLLGLRGGTSAWVDPRPAYQFREAHIPGAINIPLREVNDRSREVTSYDHLLVYGDDFNSILATSMAKSLMERGAKETSILRGGLRSWTDAGLPVESDLEGE